MQCVMYSQKIQVSKTKQVKRVLIEEETFSSRTDEATGEKGACLLKSAFSSVSLSQIQNTNARKND